MTSEEKVKQLDEIEFQARKSLAYLERLLSSEGFRCEPEYAKVKIALDAFNKLRTQDEELSKGEVGNG